MGERADEIREGMVLSGEIILPPKHPENPGNPKGNHARGGTRKGSRYGSILDDDFIAEVIRERCVKRRKVTDIADEYGVSIETVYKWSGEHRMRAPSAANVVKVREEIADELDAIALETWDLHRRAKLGGSADFELKALKQLEQTARTKALLMGANAPVRHDLTVSVVTEAERELQEMINEAKAREAAREQAVIDAASADPEL